MSSTVFVNPYMFATAPLPPSGNLSVVAYRAEAMTATASPSFTVVGYTPVADDLVVFWNASTSGATLAVVASGWTNPLGGTSISTPADGTVAVACLVHVVTPAEVSANTNSWTFTSMWNTAETGETIVAVVRGADSANPIDASAVAFDPGVVTPHVLAGLAGAGLETGSLVLSGVFPDAFETYSTPAGWSLVTASTAVNQGGAVFSRDSATSAGVDVLATNVVPSSADEYASITLAVKASP